MYSHSYIHLIKEYIMYPATINQVSSNEYHVIFNRVVVGIYSEYIHAESHAHGINLVI